MQLIQFKDHKNGCKPGGYLCQGACRNKHQSGEKWRLAQTGQANFNCPFGLPMGWTKADGLGGVKQPPPQPDPAMKERMLATQNRLLEARVEAERLYLRKCGTCSNAQTDILDGVTIKCASSKCKSCNNRVHLTVGGCPEKYF